MKTIIFSDTHLTAKFEVNKFNYLLKLINSADRIIINGDFWDSHLIDFDRFISSPWRGLFPALRKKQTIYIYGNHDRAKKCDHRVKLFSAKAVDNYVFSQSAKTYYLEHGDRLLQGKRSFLLELYYFFLRRSDDTFLDRLIHNMLHFFEQLGYKLIGSSLISNSKIARRNNLIINQLHTGKKHFLICGDTHLAEINKENGYLNTGYIGHGVASYCLINDGRISLVKEKY